MHVILGHFNSSGITQTIKKIDIANFAIFAMSFFCFALFALLRAESAESAESAMQFFERYVQNRNVSYS